MTAEPGARVAILTGASSGLGGEFARQIPEAFAQVREIWLVARRADRLSALAAALPVPCRTVAADLTDPEGLSALRTLLEAEKPDVRLLVNNAGRGYLGAFDQTDPDEQEAMIRLNITALTLVTRMALPYMRTGARVLNVSSIASFAPTPNMAVYCSTKAYVSSFSRALGAELKPRGIGVTIVCPGPMATEFVTVGRIAGRSRAFETLPYCKPASVARGALLACAKGRPVYTPRAFYKLYRLLSRVIPTRWMMRFTRT